jgi:hypothetical protein
MKEFEVTCLPNANKAVLRVLPFTSKWLNGKTYLVTQARSLYRNGREYALAMDDFNRFMETGDVSLLLRELKPSSRKRTLQLKELNSHARG